MNSPVYFSGLPSERVKTHEGRVGRAPQESLRAGSADMFNDIPSEPTGGGTE